MQKEEPDLSLETSRKIAFCGLYCPMCSFDVAAETKNRNHLRAMPERYASLKGQSFEECACPGCKAQTDNCHCSMKPCAEEKGITSCADCEAFPCREVQNFGADGVPHHADGYKNLWRIREMGYAKWLKEMEAQRCCVCGARQSWYYRCVAHHSQGDS